MIRKFLFLTFLLMMFTAPPAQADWTEEKLGKVILKADKAARQKKWGRAIKYGEQMLEGASALNQISDARYINLLKTLNRYYDKTGRLDDVTPRVRQAYILSQKHLGAGHETTMMSRLLYYKLRISHKDYRGAIPLVLENISILGKNEQDDYRRLHYLKQLYSLYGITGQLEKEEKTLLHYLDLSTQLLGENDEDNAKVIWVLVQNYCRQRKFDEFEKLIASHNLKYFCK